MRKLLILIIFPPVLCFSKSNAVFLNFGTPATTGIYYEKEMGSFAFGINPGIVALLSKQPPSWNPSIYGGYIFNKSDKIQISAILSGMYFYNYAQVISWVGSEDNLREDLIIWGPDLSARWHLSNFFFQLATGVRFSHDKQFGPGVSDNLKYFVTFYSLSFAIGYSF
jgi:hypothetical protein